MNVDSFFADRKDPYGKIQFDFPIGAPLCTILLAERSEDKPYPTCWDVDLETPDSHFLLSTPSAKLDKYSVP